MKNYLTRPLIKIFANGFYRENTGLLLTLFIVFFINFFYTNVLNQGHLTRAELIQNALKLVLTSVSEPLGVVLLLSTFSVYSFKSWQYVAKRLAETDTQFIFYSTNAASYESQIRFWLTAQFVISMPIIVIGLYAIVVGVAFGYWFVPLLIVLCIIGLNTYGAVYYVGIVNNTTIKSFEEINIRWLKFIPKQFFALFVFEIIAKKKLAYFITKISSVACIMLLFRVFNESHSDFRLFGMIGLCAALSHTILIYQGNEFDLSYLRFARNFPYGHWHSYLQQWALWCLVLLPEMVWITLVGGFSEGLIGALLLLSTVVLFQNVLKAIGPRLYYFLRLVFALFIVFLLINLFGLTLPLAVVNAAAAWALLYLYRHRLVLEEV